MYVVCLTQDVARESGPLSLAMNIPSARNLNPGGVIEMIEIIYPMQSDDDSLPEDSTLYKWSNLLHTAFANNGTAMNSALKYKDQLEEAGFISVNVVKRKWP
ncbi:hypothetical protein ACHAPJ_012049 [Fusarium lateritium]